MIEFGKTLREAREAKGYTIAQIAESTHMMSSIIQNLEDEDFSRIVAPIYGRGFVKLYCEAVGLDAKPLVSEFMDIYNGNRIPTIKERTPTAPVTPPAEEEPILAPLQEPAPQPDPVQNDPMPPPKPAQVAPPPVQPIFERRAPLPEARIAEQPQPQEPDLFNQAPAVAPAEVNADDHRFSRYASPIRETPGRTDGSLPKLSIKLPPNLWRILALCTVLVALLTLICIGIRALYHATTALPPPAAQKQLPAAVPTPASPKTPAKATPAPTKAHTKTPSAETPQPVPKGSDRTPQKIPSLYID